MKFSFCGQEAKALIYLVICESNFVMGPVGGSLAPRKGPEVGDQEGVKGAQILIREKNGFLARQDSALNF